MRVLAACLAIVVAGLACGCSLARRASTPGRPATPATATTTDAAGTSLERGTAPAVDPVLADLALYESTVAAARSGDLDAARATATRLGDAVPDSIWLGRAQLEVALAMQRAGDDAGAGIWLADAIRALDGDPPHWARARLAQAEAAARLADPVAALDHARTLRTRIPHALAARRARRLSARLVRRNGTLFPTPEARIAEAELRLTEGDHAGAKALIHDLARRDAPLRDAARWIEARAWQGLGDMRRATNLCRALAADADPRLGATALYAAARWHWNADDDALAIPVFEEVRRRFPDSVEAVSASYALGRIHQTAGRYDAAVREYDRVRSGRLMLDAAWGAAWARYLAGRWHDAAERFAALGSALGDADTDAYRYWEARALANGDDPRGVAALQRLAEHAGQRYYGHMAARYLTGAALGPRDAVVLEPRPPAFPAALGGPHADRARAYLMRGQPELARREIDALGRQSPTALLIDAYEAVGAPGRALGLVRRSFLADERRERLLYPLGHWDAVAPMARRVGVDPLLVLALIRQESAFDDDAVSPADAHGLMQLVPETAADVAAAIGMHAPDRWALHRVPLNVTLGTTHLADLLDEYAGSEIRALAAYNAGRPAVAKWSARNGHRPDDEFVELISYEETRRYVKKVLGNYLRYQQLYVASAAATSPGNPPNAPFDMMTITSPG